MAQSDQPQPNRMDPAAEVAQLRRTMIQHLTASGKLLKSVFDIDRDYFGSRFQAKVQEGAATPFRDVEVATQVVETLSEELQGAAAFADSPVLRDHIANLVAGIEQLRSQVIELEKSSLSAVGLPTEKVAFGARVFPDNNPLACVAEATGFVRDAHAWLVRTQERLKALRMMLLEAEKARSDAEQSVQSISSDEIAATLGAELQARDEDLARLRQQAAHLQDQLAAERARGGGGGGEDELELERLRGDLGAASEQVRSDHAEVRSLVVEIERIAASAEGDARPDGKDQVDDLIINLSVLRDAIADRDSTIAALTTTADAVLVEWSAWVARREQLAAAELASTRAFVAQQKIAQRVPDETAKFKSEADQARADALRLQRELSEARERLVTSAGESTRLGSELERLRTEGASSRAANDFARIQTDAAKAIEELARAKAAQGASATEVERLRAELARAQTAVDHARQAAEAAKAEAERSKGGVDAAKTEATNLRAEIDRQKIALEQAQRDLTQAKAREQQAASDLAKARDQAATAAAKLDGAAKSASDATRERDEVRKQHEALRSSSQASAEQAAKSAATRDQELAAARGKLAELQQTQVTLARERDEARSRLDDLRRTTESVTSQVTQKQDSIARELGALRDAETRVRAELAASRGETARLDSRIQGLERDVQQARDAVQAKQAEIVQLGEQIAAHQAAARQQAAAAAGELTTARAAVTRLDGELAQAKTRIAGLETSAKQLTEERTALAAQKADVDRRGGEAAAQAQQLAARLTDLQGQLESAKLVATATAGERDKLRREVERLQGEQAAFAKQMEERDGTQTARLSETGRLLGEQKQLSARLEAERDRLLAEKERLEAEKRGKQDERARETSGTAKRLSESVANLEEWRLKATNLQKRLDDSRKHEAELADASARQEQAAKHHADRVRDLERQLVELKAAAAAGRGANEREHQVSARLRVVEGERSQREKDWDARLTEMKTLLRDARASVLAAKQREEETLATDKAIIEDLMQQITALGGTPKI